MPPTCTVCKKALSETEKGICKKCYMALVMDSAKRITQMFVPDLIQGPPRDYAENCVAVELQNLTHTLEGLREKT